MAAWSGLERVSCVVLTTCLDHHRGKLGMANDQEGPDLDYEPDWPSKGITGDSCPVHDQKIIYLSIM